MYDLEDCRALFNEFNSFKGQSVLFQDPKSPQQLEFMKRAFYHGADPNLVDRFGRNSFCHCIANYRFVSIKYLELLTEAGADIDLMDFYGWSAIHYLCLSNDCITLGYLRKIGARFDVPNCDGDYPFDLVFDRAPFSFMMRVFEDNDLSFSKIYRDGLKPVPCKCCGRPGANMYCCSALHITCYKLTEENEIKCPFCDRDMHKMWICYRSIFETFLQDNLEKEKNNQ